MTWLLFIDESGHDHKNTPLEVRGGIAMHVSKVWQFVTDFKEAEKNAFGMELSCVGKEIKGAKLLEKQRFNWIKNYNTLNYEERHKAIRRFLSKQKDRPPRKREFAAYGQASLLMVDEIFELLRKYKAVLFASCIPCGIAKPKNFQFEDYLRKDHVFLQERFFWFLEAKQEHGILVMDQTETSNDKHFIAQLENNYTKTENGRARTNWIVPTPLFVDSSLTVGVQAADVCLYCINWAFRHHKWPQLNQPRPELQRYANYCGDLQFKGDMVRGDQTVRGFGIFLVADPYNASLSDT